MNQSNWVHAGFALLMQIALAPLLGLDAATAVAVTFFAAREYAQAEYRVQRHTGQSVKGMMPWHVLKWRYWNHVDSQLDWLIPAVVCGIYFGWYTYT